MTPPEHTLSPFELTAAQRHIMHAVATGQPLRLLTADEAMVQGKRSIASYQRGILWTLAANGEAIHVI